MQIVRRKPEDAQTERCLITAFIISENVCRSLKNVYKEQFFQTKSTREISKWCFEFFERYNTSPYQEIGTILDMKEKSGEVNPELGYEISQVLTELSDDYSKRNSLNEQYYIDLGYTYFKKRNFVLFSQQLKSLAEENNLDEAEKAYSSFIKVKEAMSTARDIFSPEGVTSLRESVINRPPHLFTMPGALGQMIGPIERETFIGILGREKVGKTYALMMFAIAALRQGLNVAMIETGDLTQDQLDIRFCSYMTKKASRERYVGEHISPVLDCLLNQMGECDHCKSTTPVVAEDDRGAVRFIVDIEDDDVLLAHTPCTECHKDRFLRYNKFKGSIWWEKKNIEQWTWPEVKRRTMKFKKRYKGKLITEAFPMRSVTASDIREWCINKQRQEGFVPDVLIVDYPDILLPESNKEYRHQENDKWMTLRRISQEFHNCVIVATQADAKSYNRETLQLDNYSEDKRKYGHVTHFFGVNKTQKEEMLGCCRFSTLLLREDSVQVAKQVTLLQNLKIGQPNIVSFFGKVPQL